MSWCVWLRATRASVLRGTLQHSLAHSRPPWLVTACSSRLFSSVKDSYNELKQRLPDHVLLFQVGNFYEILDTDAQKVADKLPLRMGSSGMVGFPADRLSNWAGFSLAIADQVADANRASGVRKERQLRRIITPGTLPPELNLDANVSPLVAVIPCPKRENFGLCWVDIGTGTVHVGVASSSSLADELARISPVEVLVPNVLPSAKGRCFNISFATESYDDAKGLQEQQWSPSTQLHKYYVTAIPKSWPSLTPPTRPLYSPAQWEDMRSRFEGLEIRALRVVIEYLRETHISLLPSLQPPDTFRQNQHLMLDFNTRDSLELTVRQKSKRKKGCLLDVLGRPSTTFGARELRARLESPVLDTIEINRRLDLVQFFVQNDLLATATEEHLKGCADLLKLLQNLVSGLRLQDAFSCLVGISTTISRVLEASQTAVGATGETPDAEAYSKCMASLVPDAKLKAAVDEILRLGLDYSLRDMDIGLAPDLHETQLELQAIHKELRSVETESKILLQDKFPQFKSSNSPKKLQIFNDTKEGWYLQTVSSYASLFQSDLGFIRLKSRTSSPRFTTDRLLELQEKEREIQIQFEEQKFQLIQRLRNQLLSERNQIRAMAAALADVDVCLTLARLATKQALVRPSLEDSKALDIKKGRHLMVDVVQRDQAFVANDCSLTETPLWLITGANMGGKSTFLRQNALIVILAQMGSFVPADSATIGVVDRIFTRVGAGDNLAQHQSTFMLEMQETARILNQATSSSFVILDEIGRGTGPLDGLAIAWAITKHLALTIQCRTLSATHYFHLTKLCKRLPQVGAYQLATARDPEGGIILSHRLVPGTAQQSYGVEIAELAGTPAEVVADAAKARDRLQEYSIEFEQAIEKQGVEEIL